MKLSTILSAASLIGILPLSASLFAQAPEKAQIMSSEIRSNVHLLTGDGGNIAVLNGERSLLVIDNGYAEQAADLYDSIVAVGNKPIRFLVNTHWHFDHAGGNEFLGHRTNIVAHENVRKRLAEGQNMKAFNRVIEPVAPQGLPVVTYTEGTTLYEAGQVVRLQHFAKGHTDGDSIAFIKPAKIVHMGDHYFAGMFPFIDLGSGGSVQGVARNIEQVLTIIDDSWVVIPGHGPLSTKADLAKTLTMLQQSIAWMREQIAAGLSVEQISQSGLPKNLEPWNVGFIKAPNWIATVHASLSAENK